MMVHCTCGNVTLVYRLQWSWLACELTLAATGTCLLCKPRLKTELAGHAAGDWECGPSVQPGGVHGGL